MNTYTDPFSDRFFKKGEKALKNPQTTCDINLRDAQITLLMLSEKLDDFNKIDENQTLITKLKEIVVLADGNNPDYQALFLQAYHELANSKEKPAALSEIEKKFGEIIIQTQMHSSRPRQ